MRHATIIMYVLRTITYFIKTMDYGALHVGRTAVIIVLGGLLYMWGY